MFNSITHQNQVLYDGDSGSNWSGYAAAGASAAAAAGGIIANANLSKKMRQWSEKMTQQQREWALADWNSMNEYNHPSSQMARLREAGLNPNLVYGKGADNTAVAVNRSQTTPWQPNKVDTHGLQQSLFVAADLRMKQAQTDNLRVQNTVLEQEKLLKAATTSQALENAATTKQQREQAQSLFPFDLQAKVGQIQKTEADTAYTLAQNERQEALNASGLKEAAERILKMRAERANTELEKTRIQEQINVLRQDQRVREVDAQLADKNIRPTDNFFLRKLQELMKALGDKVKGSMKFGEFN